MHKIRGESRVWLSEWGRRAGKDGVEDRASEWNTAEKAREHQVKGKLEDSAEQ